MIQYSNINDVWGNKEMYKKKEPFVNKETINIDNDKETINIDNKETINNNRIYEKKILREHFTDGNTSCSMIEHLENCPTCKEKIMEMFSNNKTDVEPKYATINLFFFKINITKDVLKLIFVLLIILIFVIFLSIINVPLISNNNAAASAKYYLVPQNELNNLVRLGIH